mmetsp:Transcript_14241/g.57322  ORF Transcript_14241/g.57322 Transcript_14241/m.57322 type:complete len:174 (-) Transcript_14241:1279-1800(-)
MLGHMLRCRIRQWSCGEAILRSTLRLYRVLTSWCRAQVTSALQRDHEKRTNSFFTPSSENPKIELCVSGQLSSVLASVELVTKLAESSSLLTPKVYSFLTYLTTFQCSGNAKSRTLKESKLVPNLIFNIEQYESSLIRLNRKFEVTTCKTPALPHVVPISQNNLRMIAILYQS